MQTPTVGELDRRIIGCLQVDGRASWRRIAAALGEPERTVARHGTRLLADRTVVVTGLSIHGEASLLRAACMQAATRVAAASLARRDGVTFTYMLTGSADCVAEIMCPAGRLGELLLDEIPGIPGLTQFTSLPILRYFRTVHEWQPGLVTPAEAEAVRGYPAITPVPSDQRIASLSREERQILRALATDGRRTHDEIARLVGLSEPTVRRRVDYLRREGHVHFRAVVDPAALGLPVEAILWIKAAPTRVPQLGDALLLSPNVRYAAAVMGEHQVVADVTVADRAALYAFVTEAPWVRHAENVETSLVVRALKRSGILDHRAD
ncbi:Lrp/AsnC family transcriptional regulator [Yinghuangia seranimata]|uniref:Lrp/AsnC family transcriptional regulator n=1 Tax=Yinghuangia seranimata TaxID=408067 RepID=UPI00248CBF9D|nr:Lrp/AsnC family transcriptional regulator [Yinghuangia seranimata]MDI2132106.1 Lrp/AsnC family transcriptional regulator [Yinghuangia seranimata]